MEPTTTSTTRKHTSNRGNSFVRRVKRWFRKLTGQSSTNSRHHRSSSHRHTHTPASVPIPIFTKSKSRDDSPYLTKVVRRLKRRLRRLTGKSSSRGRHSKPAMVFDASNLIPDSERSGPRVQGKYPRLNKYIRRIKTRFRNLTGGKSRRVHHRRSSSKVQMPILTPVAVKEKSDFRNYLPYVVNSTMMFLLAYLVAWLTNQLAVIISASFFHIDSVLFYYEVMFPIGTVSRLWTVQNIIFITFSGPFFSLVTGSLYFILIIHRKKAKGNARMFFIWLIIHSFCMFFAAFVAGAVTRRGFGYVLSWTGMSIPLKIVISSIFLSFLTLVGYLGSRYILETTNTVSRIRSNNRKIFLISQTVLPWLVGSLILTALKYPTSIPQHDKLYAYDMMIIACILFLIIPPFFNKLARTHVIIDKTRQRTQVSIWGVFFSIITLFVFRGGLSYGLHFIINFSMNISLYK